MKRFKYLFLVILLIFMPCAFVGCANDYQSEITLPGNNQPENPNLPEENPDKPIFPQEPSKPEAPNSSVSLDIAFAKEVVIKLEEYGFLIDADYNVFVKENELIISVMQDFSGGIDSEEIEIILLEEYCFDNFDLFIDFQFEVLIITIKSL